MITSAPPVSEQNVMTTLDTKIQEMQSLQSRVESARNTEEISLYLQGFISCLGWMRDSIGAESVPPNHNDREQAAESDGEHSRSTNPTRRWTRHRSLRGSARAAAVDSTALPRDENQVVDNG